MDFYQHLKRFFGLGGYNGRNNQYFDDQPERPQYWESRSQEPPCRYNEGEEDDGMNSIFSFNVFTDPLQMHTYFEHKMNELMRQFGMGAEDSFFGNQFPQLPSIGEDPAQRQPPFRSLRDQYLKPGYHSTNESDGNHKVDVDVDGKISSEDLDSLFKDKPSQQITPYQGRPKMQFFGQSVTSRTIQKADGTFETHRTIRDNDGNEETTVTTKRGDQEYTIITKRDKNGQEERTENLVNLDEKDLSSFLNGGSANLPGNNSPMKLPDKYPPNWFDFDKFFK